MRAVIVGCGRVGALLALRLVSEGHSVCVIDEKPSAFERLGEDFDGEMVVGNGLESTTLRRAGIEKADCFAAVMPGDNRNLMAAQLAREIFKVPRVITRIYDPIRAQVYREMGVETICSTVIGATLIHDFLIDGVNRADAVVGAGART
ncbi:MAG TPA: TrkA family potassium uptake protein [Candidatus Dormibacteraeota bacterium]|jgi:trk system potassium uptake protein TrkA|nr:TrkA family potassium uptake protein [Candidatus Dormibacteraeota bacterium]